MIGSGRVGSDSGWVGLARNFVCNFLIGSDFFEFQIKYSGRVGFLSDGLDRIYRVGGP